MSIRPKKVLVFVQSEVGGAERVSVTIGKTLDKKKFKVSFCSIGSGENKTASFIPIDYPRDQIKTNNFLKKFWFIYKKIKQEQPDIIFASVININTKILLLKPFFPNVKFVIRSDNNFYYFSKRHQWMIRFIYKHAHTIIAQTSEMKDGLVQGAKIDTSKIIVLQNPVDTEYIDEKVKNTQSPFSNNGNFKIVASGRFSYVKGFDILIEAFNLLRDNFANTELFILGRTGGENNPIYKNVKKLIDTYQLNNCVHCVGHLSNPYPYVKHANCFVLSSRAEGLPNVVLEALYLHTPVVATKCIPAISRLIKDGKNGFCAETENPISLAENIQKCLAQSHFDFTTQSTTLSSINEIFER